MKKPSIKLGNTRLLKLARHLESGKLGHKTFDFSQYNNGGRPKCGTKGCAIGECPVLFKEDWKWMDGGMPALRRNQWATPSVCGMEYFELDTGSFARLFVPNIISGGVLPNSATPKQVAAAIREFVKRRSA